MMMMMMTRRGRSEEGRGESESFDLSEEELFLVLLFPNFCQSVNRE